MRRGSILLKGYGTYALDTDGRWFTPSDVCGTSTSRIFNPLAPDSWVRIVSDREFSEGPIERLVTSIESRLESALPKSFRSARPANEGDLNDKD